MDRQLHRLRYCGSYVVELYNNIRLHSAIGYVAPKDKLEGRDQQIHDERDRKLAEARDRRKQLRQAEHEQQADKRINESASENARPAIDFAAVRAAITIAAVLQLLGCELHAKGAQHRGPCPLHGSTSGTSRCFSANLNEHIFHCFKCNRSGNALDLWAQAHRLTIYDAAIDLCQRLHFPLPTLPAPSRHREEETVAPSSNLDTMTSAST